MPRKKKAVEDKAPAGTELLDAPHGDTPGAEPDEPLEAKGFGGELPHSELPEPAIGAWCWYWGYSPGTHLQPVPAQFIQKNLQNGLWHLNIHQLGIVGMQLDVPYTDTPKMGCWSWPE